jgi:hypothetical protein
MLPADRADSVEEFNQALIDTDLVAQMEKMVVFIRQDLQDQILSRRPKEKGAAGFNTRDIKFIYETQPPITALDYNAGEFEPWIEEYSVRQCTFFHNGDGTDIASEIVEDGASESCPENVNKEDYDHLSFGGHKVAPHK